MTSANLRLLDSKLKEERQYWEQKLSGELVVSAVPADYIRPDMWSDEKSELGFEIKGATRAKLLQVSSQSQALILTILSAVLKICLHKYTGIEDVIIGTPVHSQYAELAALNKVLALRDRLNPDESVKQLLGQVKQTIAEAYANQKYPFERILELLEVKWPNNQPSLFSTVITLRGINDRAHLQQLKYDLGLHFELQDEALEALIEYNPALYARETVEVFAEHFQEALHAALHSPDALIADLELATPVKKRAFLETFNQTSSPYPQHQTIHRLFEAQVERTPESIAASYQGENISYRELNRRANQLAHYLRAAGIGPGMLVGLCLEHTPDMLVAILGVLKAGAAYVPLDPTHPLKRLGLMLEDAHVQHLITQEHLAEKLPTSHSILLVIDEEWESIAAFDAENPEPLATDGDMAYLLYTSGSTGQPKGVMVVHRSLVNYAVWAARAYFDHDLSRVDEQAQAAHSPKAQTLSCALYSSLAFDLTLTSIFPPLIAGQRIVIYRSTGHHATLLAEILADNQVEVLKLTPSHLRLLTERKYVGQRLRRLIVGGEAFTAQLAEAVRQSFGDEVEILNEYGPTEATVACMLHRYEPETDRSRAQVPIGLPAANVQIYLLDQKLEPLAELMTGELYIAGDGLAQGYWRQAALTAERFISNPFAPNTRMYRTGDLARRLSNGRIEYLGRLDEQVKYHGNRVELSELRAALNRHPQVRDSVVLLRRDERGHDVMVAYYVSRQKLDAVELRELMKESIVEEVLPSVYVHLKRLPLTLNGKLDQSGLPGLREALEELTAASDTRTRTATQEMVAAIWSEVLGLKKIGVEDNFFALGGHSLLATQVISRVQEAFRVELPLRVLFESPTVEELAESIDEAISKGHDLLAPPIKPASREGELPLSYAQQRLWFLDQLEPGGHFCNIPIAVRMQGRLDVPALERTFSEIIRRHEALRTVFPTVEGQPVQTILPAVPFKLPLLELRALPEDEREAEVKRLTVEEAEKPFDLAAGPLMRVSLLRVNPEEHILLVTMHHIISDGWSIGVLIREVTLLYRAFVLGEESPLDELVVQYADYAHWQREWLQGEALEKQLDYWKRALAGAPDLLELPLDKPRPLMQSYHGANYTITLPLELVESLKELSRAEGVTLFMTLLAAFQLLLHRYSGQEDILVSTGIAGRARVETEPLVGFFINTLIIRTDFSGGPTFRQLLHQVRETTLGAYAHQDLPFEKLVETLQPERNPSYQPLAQVMFVLQNLPPENLSLPGLQLSMVENENTITKFDMALIMEEGAEGMSATLQYCVDLFELETIKQMLSYLRGLLESIVENPDEEVTGLSMIPAGESPTIQEAWS